MYVRRLGLQDFRSWPQADLDLERFTSMSEVKKHPKVWQAVVEQLSLGEMPPKEKKRPDASDMASFIKTLDVTLTSSDDERTATTGYSSSRASSSRDGAGFARARRRIVLHEPGGGLRAVVAAVPRGQLARS